VGDGLSSAVFAGGRQCYTDYAYPALLDPQCETDNYDEARSLLKADRLLCFARRVAATLTANTPTANMPTRLLQVGRTADLHVLGDAGWHNANLTTTRDIVRIKLDFGHAGETGRARA
jgi:hypothetical protein